MSDSVFRRKGARLKEDVDEELAKRYHPGPEEDIKHQLKPIQEFDKAHAVMLYEEGLMSKEVAVKVLGALRELEAEGVEKTRLGLGGSAHTGELYITKKYGESVGGRLHIGRSSGDLDAVYRTLALRARILLMMEANLDYRNALVNLAEKHFDTIMLSFSFHQPAQATTFAHYLVAWNCVAERNFERLASLYARNNISPAGAAIGTGTEFPLNRRRVAELLGYDNVSKNTRDSIFNLDGMLEAHCIISIMCNDLGRFADDLQMWTTHEFDWIELADRYCTTSSIMPQKKNPEALEYVRAISAVTLGHLVTAFATMKSTSDVIEPHEFVPWELWKSIDSFLGAINIMTGVLRNIRVKRQNMLSDVGETWVFASDLAGMIVREKDLPFRSAHQIVAIMVREAIDGGKKPTDTTTEMIDHAAVEYTGYPLNLDRESIREVLDPGNRIKMRTLTGGVAPDEVRKQVLEARQVLDRDSMQVKKLQTILKERATKLDKAANEIESTKQK
jgi:argininosuccinate lyase